MAKGPPAQNRMGMGYGQWVAPGGMRQHGADNNKSFPKKGAWGQPAVPIILLLLFIILTAGNSPF